MVKREYSVSLQTLAEDIAKRLFPHINTERIRCYRVFDEVKGDVLARCHALSETMQIALGIEPFYVLEFLTKKFNKLTTAQKAKVVIHELLNISLDFDGGFMESKFVNSKNVYLAYENYLNCRKNDESIDFFREIVFRKDNSPVKI